MRYWAVGRSLGLTDTEFQKSSLAKIDALYKVQIYTWQRTRDYFPALLASLYLSRNKEKGSRVITPDDILSHRYRRLKDGRIKHDPDRGAAGDWRELKSSLKGKTASQAAKHKRLRIFEPAKV